MLNRLIILSDIHANVTALQAVINDIRRRGYTPDAIVSLGDVINYGMRPNESIQLLKNMQFPLMVNLFGNHEKAVMDGDLSKFSSDRGRHILGYTSNTLSAESREFIDKNMCHAGFETRRWQGKNILFVHGSIHDPYWGTIKHGNISDERYGLYDIVVSGHSHVPHYMEYFYDADNPYMRNKKRIVFVNPGSVGQPRNHNPRAQYVYMELSSEIIHFNTVEYDVAAEQRLYPEYIDSFYKDRLVFGI